MNTEGAVKNQRTVGVRMLALAKLLLQV